jgi:hypothetical protein
LTVALFDRPFDRSFDHGRRAECPGAADPCCRNRSVGRLPNQEGTEEPDLTGANVSREPENPRLAAGGRIWVRFGRIAPDKIILGLKLY